MSARFLLENYGGGDLEEALFWRKIANLFTLDGRVDLQHTKTI